MTSTRSAARCIATSSWTGVDRRDLRLASTADSRQLAPFWSTFYETFDQVNNYPEEFVDNGEHVMVVSRSRLVGRDGIEVETHSVQVATIRDGLIVVWRLYKTREEALKAVGLEE